VSVTLVVCAPFARGGNYTVLRTSARQYDTFSFSLVDVRAHINVRSSCSIAAGWRVGPRASRPPERGRCQHSSRHSARRRRRQRQRPAVRGARRGPTRATETHQTTALRAPRRVLRAHVPHRALPGAGRSPFTPATSRQGARRGAAAHRTPDPPPLTTDSTVALGSRAGDEPVHTCTHTHSIDTRAHTHARPRARRADMCACTRRTARALRRQGGTDSNMRHRWTYK
jgi:hypothetical protein